MDLASALHNFVISRTRKKLYATIKMLSQFVIYRQIYFSIFDTEMDFADMNRCRKVPSFCDSIRICRTDCGSTLTVPIFVL